MQSLSDPAFDNLLTVIQKFKLYTKPINERELEKYLAEHLRKNGIDVGQQHATSLGRYDLEVKQSGKKYIIELKNRADRSCTGQLDRYANDADGLILVCWKASKDLRIVFAVEKQRARIPIALVEVKRNCSIV